MVMNKYSELLQGDKVRAKTLPEINQIIDIETAAMIRFYASKTEYEINKRIEELDREWDIGRIVEVRAATVSIIGMVFGLKSNKKWLILPTIASIFLLQYAIQGWCPPVSLLRRFGFRTRQEIDLEKCALKALREEHHENRHHGDHHHGDHNHGDNHHGDHNHGDHNHGDHHGDHNHGDHHGDHNHGDHHHGDHDHGDHHHGDHDHGDHHRGDHNHGDHHGEHHGKHYH